MHQKLLFLKYAALKQLVYSQLVIALSVYTSEKKIIFIANQNIALYKAKDNSRVLYISGVALRLSKSHHLPAMEIASEIASYLSASGDEFSVQIVAPGWIHLELTQPVLAAWLQSLVMGEGKKEKWGQIPSQDVNSQIQNSLFGVQYAHARCCSLLRLSGQEELIKLKQPNSDTSPATWSVISPNPIPWLNRNAKLRLNHPSELRLIGELIQVLDDLNNFCLTNSINWEKAAQDLSQAFETFWCNCRIWGEVKTTSPELAQSRLGLVIATQSVLNFLLLEKLGIYPPLEL